MLLYATITTTATTTTTTITTTTANTDPVLGIFTMEVLKMLEDQWFV